MSDATEFRLRARAVRGAAREHLRELRAQRLARRTTSPDEERACVNVFLEAADSPVYKPEPFAVSPAASGAVVAAPLEGGTETGGPTLTQGLSGGASAADAARDLSAQGDPELDVEGAPDAVPAADAQRAREAAWQPHPEADTSIGPDEGAAGMGDLSPGAEHETRAEDGAEPGGNGRPARDLTGIFSPSPDAATMPDETDAEPDLPATPDADGTPEAAAPSPPAEEKPGAPEPAERDADVTAHAAETDLYRLHGAGPGLVWMLGQCGIHSLRELGDADAGVLQDRLGIVGQILDVPAWIAFARECAPGGAKAP